MNLLGPELVEFLRRVRFVGLAASAPFGHGERRSLATGAGVEFAELRPYEPGDDLRRVDYSAFLRHGRLYTKLFHADGPGSIALFIDSSASMTCGEPPKFRFALVLAAAIGFVALRSGDEVAACAFARGRIEWTRRLRGARRATDLCDWLNGLRPGGATEFGRGFVEAAASVDRPGLAFLISDGMGGGVEQAVAALAAQGQAVVFVHLLAPEDVEPGWLDGRVIRLVDSESGNRVEANLTGALAEAYRRRVERWREEVGARVAAAQGRVMSVRSDGDVRNAVLAIPGVEAF